MKNYIEKILNIDVKLTNYKPIIKKHLIALISLIVISIILFFLFWDTALRIILLLPILLVFGVIILFVIKIINVYRKKGYKFFKSIVYEFKQIRLSHNLKYRFYYLKHNFVFKCLSFLYRVFRVLILLSVPFLFIYVPFSKSFINSFKSLPEQTVDNLFDISTMIFGIVITLFSILVSTRQNRIYNENEHKLVLKYNIGIYSLKQLIIYNIIYFVLVIINYVFGTNSAISIIFLIIYGLFAIVSLTFVINSSIVKIYYNVNNLGKINIFQRRKGNFVNFIGKYEKFDEKIDDIIKLSLSTPFLEFSIHLDKLTEKVFYSQNQIKDFDVELFSKYTNEYFKQIKNDSQIFGIYIYIEHTKKILKLLYEKKEYQFFEQIVYLINEQLMNFFNSKTMSRRFGKVSREECIMSIFYDKLVSSIYYRNIMIIETVISSVKGLNDFINDIMKNENKFYKLNNIIYEEKQNKIINVLNSYKANNDLFNNIMIDIIDDFNKIVEVIIAKIEQKPSNIKNDN